MKENPTPKAAKETGEDVLNKMLHDDAKRMERLEKTMSFILKFTFAIPAALIVIFIIGFYIQSARHNSETQKIEQRAENRIENNRKALLEGLYTVRETSADALSTREERLERFLVKGKRVILERHSDTDLSDEDINNLLVRNFELAERYDMSPWIFMAFAAVESDFTKGAVSSAGAKGLVQFMPSTMAMVLADDYRPGMEHDPIVSVEAWYKYVSYLSNSVDGDLEWTAASYMAPSAIQWKNEGKTIEEFMDWIITWSDNQVRYPENIRKLVVQYSNM